MIRMIEAVNCKTTKLFRTHETEAAEPSLRPNNESGEKEDNINAG